MTIKNFLITILVITAFIAGQQIISAATSTGRTSICVGQCPRSELGCWPVSGDISQEIGESFSHGDSTSLDIGAPTGTEVYAPVSGTVITYDGGYCSTTWLGGDNFSARSYGCAAKLVIDSGTYAGYILMFGHLACTDGKCQLENTGHVDAGTLLGRSDNSGSSTGPHLHYEILNPDGTSVFPGTIPAEELLDTEKTLCSS